jgi:hypothetical protein
MSLRQNWRAVIREVGPHHPAVVVPIQVVEASCGANMRSVLTAIGAYCALDLIAATQVAPHPRGLLPAYAELSKAACHFDRRRGWWPSLVAIFSAIC